MVSWYTNSSLSVCDKVRTVQFIHFWVEDCIVVITSSCSCRAESGALRSTEQARCLNCFLLDAPVLCPTSSWHEVHPVLLGVASRICCFSREDGRELPGRRPGPD